MTGSAAAAVWALASCFAQELPEPRFGTTVYASIGFEGQIYAIPEDTKELPNFKKLKPMGRIYTSSINVPPQRFEQGFPGVTDRFEWFAIDYNGKFWIEESGKYTFALVSDDGSRLWVDGKDVVDNDGIHPAKGKAGTVKLKRGVHALRVSYFQGPRFHVALVLLVAKPGQHTLQIFRAEEYQPRGEGQR